MFKGKNMWLVVVVIISVFLIVGLFVYYYCRWKHLWALDEEIPSYETRSHVSDALKIVMIGDSWAGLHHENGMDAFLCSKLQEKVSCPVNVTSKGKGGEISRGVYRLMFSIEGYGTKSLLVSQPDYCIISVGINDAAANLGTYQYCHYYRQILDFLQTNHIRPVVLEIPDINIWHLYGGKPIKDLTVDFVRSMMTRCKMYQFHEYREALFQMLVNEHYLEKVIYIPMKEWNSLSPDIDKRLFTEDQIHLNRQGYEKLDSCIALAIARDLEKSGDSYLIH